MGILDLLHANTHLWEAVHQFHAPESALALKLMELLVLARLAGDECGGGELAGGRGAGGGARQEPTAPVDQDVPLFSHRHQARMRYHEYLAAGYPIAAGVIAGACRQVVKDRMERAGMHWTIPGAQALLRLRGVALNGEWAAFMQYRIQQETARLYPHAELVGQAAWPSPWRPNDTGADDWLRPTAIYHLPITFR